VEYFKAAETLRSCSGICIVNTGSSSVHTTRRDINSCVPPSVL